MRQGAEACDTDTRHVTTSLAFYARCVDIRQVGTLGLYGNNNQNSGGLNYIKICADYLEIPETSNSWSAKGPSRKIVG
jgi:hypothetical protein